MKQRPGSSFCQDAKATPAESNAAAGTRPALPRHAGADNVTG